MDRDRRWRQKLSRDEKSENEGERVREERDEKLKL